jgi:S1-C subfamily serine protease
LEDADAVSGNEDKPEPGDAPQAARGRLRGKLWFRVAVSLGVAVLAAGIGFGVASSVGRPVPADARIPSPPSHDAAFTEDDNGAGQDQQDNILQASARSVVDIQSGHGALLGSGFIITRSGFVLASYHGLSGVPGLTARLVMSGKTYPARLVGSDPVANLALLQLSGGASFTPVTVGTADGIGPGDRVASAGGNPTAKGLLLSTGAVTGTSVPVTLDGQKLTGLLEVTSLDVPAGEIGGPLFNLSGQVLGIDIAAGLHQTSGDGYVVPIDDALSIARQLAGQ